jgi:hypothetical protein
LNLVFSDGTAPYINGYLSATGSLVANTWYNVVVVLDRSSVAQAYINGVKIGISLSIAAQQGSITNYTSYKIGSFSSSEYHLAGKMDEFRLYNAAMLTSQIQEQYYIGLNKLLASGGIRQEEYSQKLDILASK